MKRKKLTLGRILINLFFVMLCLVFIIPVVTVISVSFTDELHIVENGFGILPGKFSTSAFEFIFKNPEQIINAYKTSTLVSALGTFFSVLFMLMCSYSLARDGFKYKRLVSFYLFFTMLFSGGLVPRYILIASYLNLQNTLLVLILSQLVNVWYIFILRTFISDIPKSIIESAMIDGASEFKIFGSFIIPLSKPAIATIGMLVLLGYWNEWMSALLYITEPKLYPLQYLLQKVLQDLEAVLQSMEKSSAMQYQGVNIPNQTVRMAMAVVAAGPMLFIMPFFQKYFVRGMTLGSVKG